MIIKRFKQGVLATLLAALVLTGLSPTVATAVDDPQFSVSPAAGRPGEPIRVTGDDPCPPIPTEGYGDMPYQDAVLTLVDSAGVSTGDQVLTGTGNGGEWDAEARIPTPHFPPPVFDASKFTREPAIGMGMLYVRCVLPDGAVAQEYAPQPFNVTGPAYHFTVSTSVDPGGNLHFESVDPCPSPQDRVQVSVFNDDYVTYTDVTPGSDGHWTADIPATYDDMGNVMQFKSGPLGSGATCMNDATAETPFVYASKLSTVTGNSGGGSNGPCKDALFVAVTGSGEHYDGDANLTVSPTLRKVYQGFSNVYPTDKSLGIKVLDYPALSVDTLFEGVDGINLSSALKLLRHNAPKYLGGKTAGLAALYGVIGNSYVNCPNQDVVLAGYSQGAMIVHQMLEGLSVSADPVREVVKASVLIADPMRTPNSRVTTFGDAPADSKGLCKMAAMLDACATDGVDDIPAEFRQDTTSVCEHYDAVCDTKSLVADLWPLGFESAKQTGVMVHSLYAATPETKTAGKRAARRVLRGE